MNALGKDLRGKAVVLKQNRVTGTNPVITTRLFICEAGAGLFPQSQGVTIRGRFVNNPIHGKNIVTIDGDDVERLATDSEVAVAL